ncbi:MAG: hypothetical protein ACSLEL_01855 [Candidatus Malihini olakiniferum]
MGSIFSLAIFYEVAFLILAPLIIGIAQEKNLFSEVEYYHGCRSNYGA